ncbi:MAG: carboxypeptidase-like regulatory domain-containing protein [Janthinobacterium lividum]
MTPRYLLLPTCGLLLGCTTPDQPPARRVTAYEPGRVLSFGRVAIMDTTTAILNGQAVSLCNETALPLTVWLAGMAPYPGTEVTYRVIADVKGKFRFFHVSAGTYRLSAAYSGYGSLAEGTVHLGTGDVSAVKIGLSCRLTAPR